MSRKQPPPKPCPRCYVPMRKTAEGFACDRHGAPPPEQRRREEAFIREPKPRRQVKPSRPPRPPYVPSQTRRLTAMRDAIEARNKAGESIASIAADLWRELGYQNQYVCASKISRFLTLRGVKSAPVRSGPAPGSRAAARFSEERLAEVRAALAAGSTVWAFAGECWQEWGFTSRSSCDSLIRKWLRTKVEHVDLGGAA